MDIAGMMATERGREQLMAVPAAGLLHGALDVFEEDFRWVRPLRFTAEQRRALGSCQAWHPGLYRQMALCTAGICVEFETDATEVALEVWVDAEPKGTRAVLDDVDRFAGSTSDAHDGLSADVDGRHSFLGMPGQAERLVAFSLADETETGLQPLPGLAKTHHVRIWLPALRGCQVRDLWCDGSFVRVLPRRGELLVLGDSIAQGFVSVDPANSWPALLAGRLGLDVVNQGVGGQVFQPGSLGGLASLVEPARIVVALGANYRYEPCAERRVSADIGSYLREVARLWPEVPTCVVTPLWHEDGPYPSHARSCHEQVPALIAQHAAQHASMTLVDGLDLLDHEMNLMADGFEHPNERGCRQIASKLSAVMRVPGLRAASVGKRRKPRARVEEPQETVLTMQLPFVETL